MQEKSGIGDREAWGPQQLLKCQDVGGSSRQSRASKAEYCREQSGFMALLPHLHVRVQTHVTIEPFQNAQLRTSSQRSYGFSIRGGSEHHTACITVGKWGSACINAFGVPGVGDWWLGMFSLFCFPFCPKYGFSKPQQSALF